VVDNDATAGLVKPSFGIITSRQTLQGSSSLQAIHEAVPDMKEIAEKTNMKTQARSTRTIGPEITTHSDILDTSQVRRERCPLL
jgi:hypothetical protein